MWLSNYLSAQRVNHVTDLIRNGLLQLHVPQRIAFKRAILTAKHQLAPVQLDDVQLAT